MIRWIFVAFALFLSASGAQAQGYSCRTSPTGASTSYCASEAFVTGSRGTLTPAAFSTLAACSGTTEGQTADVTDSTTDVFGATITGSGSFHVLAYCNGTNWTVAGGGVLAPGVDISTINAQTGGYAIANTDCGKVIYATGGQNTIALPSTSGFPATCTVTVKNGEIYNGSTGHAKKLSGFPSDVAALLWPLQAVTVKIDGGAWITTVNPGRWKVPAGVTLHVDKTNGSDANDCLATTTGACQDAQTAWNIQQYQFDNQGTSPIIAMACSQTHTVALSMGGTPIGTNLVQLSPDGNCAFIWTNAGPCIALADLAELNLDINFYGSSGGVTFGCNSGNTVSSGNIYLHNEVVLDVEGAVTWDPGGTNDNWLFCDGPCEFTIANGITQATNVTANYIINMSQGGKGTQSGTISASASGSAAGIYFLFNALLSLGTPNGTGWASIGTSKVYGHATLVNNGITPQGGVSVGTSGVNCTSLTSSC